MRADVLRPWRPARGHWDRGAAAHLLRRAGFGARPAELERALAQGLEATLADVLVARDVSERRAVSEHDDHPRDDDALRESARAILPTGSLDLLQAWWMALILEGVSPLRERMAFVWHAHFATSNDKVNDVRLMHAQNELLRSQGLGDFRALLHAIARDPAMLVWLDGDSNRSGHPNENFAREVLELFALGIGHYREEDVQEAARAFSGWGTEGRAFVFRSEHHDAGTKTVFGRSGNWSGDQVIDLVLEHPACSRHVARLLLRAFVAPEAESDWIEALAAVLREREWHIGRTLEVLLSSELFFSFQARRARIAGPVELLAQAVRALDARIAPRRAAVLCAEMGQALFQPPSVKGWDGGRTWIHSGSWIARHNAMVEVAEAHGNGLGGADSTLPHRVLEALLPGGDDARLRAVLERARADARDADHARRLVTALVLTSPEFQLF